MSNTPAHCALNCQCRHTLTETGAWVFETDLSQNEKEGQNRKTIEKQL